MRVHTVLLAFSVGLVPLSAAAQLRGLPTADIRMQLQSESTDMMLAALDSARRGVLRPAEGPIIRLPYICPHAMGALAAIAAGAVDMDTGAKLFFQGLVDDQANFMRMKIVGGAMADMSHTGAEINVKMSDKVDARQLASLIEAGRAFLK
ncbi:hypothetical protein [Sagittula salina]|uniref:Uncharacterized protein n=1 Tax=Sagittula salina TaxID=2820268 RepID=A0A940MJG0_9RHOB|nr:hypothetical protein [Sagittula salina]MBP0482905.1 hypothetical protein [Sagittula salina]